MKTERIHLSSTGPGHSVFLTTHRFSGNSEKKVYLQAALHADEVPGVLVLHHLIQELKVLEEQGKLRAEFVIVPYANPLGFGQFLFGSHVGRYDMASGLNHNRKHLDFDVVTLCDWPSLLTQNQQENTKIIRQKMLEKIGNLPHANALDEMRMHLMRMAAVSDLVYDLHCDDDSELYMFSHREGWPTMKTLADSLRVDFAILHDDDGSGTFDLACQMPWIKMREKFGDSFPIGLGCISTTIELRGQDKVSDQLAKQDCSGLIDHFIEVELIDGHKKLSSATYDVFDYEALDYVRLPQSGVFFFEKKLGDVVSAGEQIGWVIDPSKDIKESRVAVTSPIRGKVIDLKKRRFGRKGEIVAGVAGAERLAHRIGNLNTD